MLAAIFANALITGLETCLKHKMKLFKFLFTKAVALIYLNQIITVFSVYSFIQDVRKWSPKNFRVRFLPFYLMECTSTNLPSGGQDGGRVRQIHMSLHYA